jgi:hypothetical protein
MAASAALVRGDGRHFLCFGGGALPIASGRFGGELGEHSAQAVIDPDAVAVWPFAWSSSM